MASVGTDVQLQEALLVVAGEFEQEATRIDASSVGPAAADCQSEGETWDGKRPSPMPRAAPTTAASTLVLRLRENPHTVIGWQN